jgi:DUF1680 family protein
MITTTQSFATGGWGPDESFRAPGTGALNASLTGTHHSFETPCGSYAHFKLTRYLLRVTRNGRYGDSMERVLYNTVLGAKRLEPNGRAFYYSDYHSPGKKSYFPDLWPCCSGTLPQVACDYRILAYFRDGNGIFVNLYMPSTLRWTTAEGAQFELTQSGDYPVEGNVTMRLRARRPSKFALRMRIPGWSSESEVAISVNGVRVPAPVESGFVTLHRQWKDADRIDLSLRMPIRLEAIDGNHPDTVALLRGPLVLFPITENPPVVTRRQLLAAVRVPQSAGWRAQSDSGPLHLLPFTAIEDQPYTTYLTVK